MLNDVFSVPMSLGGLSNCEAQLADALQQPYNEAAEHVIEQDVAHADETGWPRGNKRKGWLWTFCCATAAVFMVHANRSQQAARKLIGGFSGKLVSDRYYAYNFYKLIRQICWAHLKQAFKAISEAKGVIGKIGGKCREILKHKKYLWTFVRDQRVEPTNNFAERIVRQGVLWRNWCGNQGVKWDILSIGLGLLNSKMLFNSDFCAVLRSK